VNYTALLILACIFIPLERLLPLHGGQRILRRDWLLDLTHLMFNHFLIRAGSVVVVGGLMAAYTWAVPHSATDWVRALPLWAQLIGVLVVADVGYYTAHRLAHAIPFLWKFHSVHHSIEEMDWLASHRVHPFDQIFTNTLSLFPVFCLGFSAPAMVLFSLIFQAQSLWLHSNTRITIGPLKWLIASPEYHHWHHANQREAYDRNFSALLSVIDVIGGTIFLPKSRPERFGVSDPVPKSYPQQLLYPFKRIFQERTQHRNATESRVPNPTEDRLGKAFLILVFSYSAATSMKYLAALLLNYERVPYGALIFLAQCSNLLFLSLVVYFTLTRLPPRNTLNGVMPRAIAVIGTFSMMLVGVTPHVDISPALRVTSTVFVVMGTILSILCLARLGKSFSVAPSARALVTSGPYRIVRHPLYAAEALTIVGIAMSNGSAAAYMIAVACLCFQVARARLEEQVLSQTFPEYHDYATRVPMLVPGLQLLFPRATSEEAVQGEAA
jgi:sterol desaturase/sphingolipid hydroxylase (fatty acid hydroxylase superfamily)/protein-S-isoprenylcysteine O-methyltransferase Ste14